MAIAKTLGWSFGSGTTSAVATYLSTPTQGNLLIAVGNSSDVGIAGATLTGWTKAIDTNFGSTAAMGIWYKIAGASESTTVTLTWTSSSSTFLVVSEWSDVNTLDQTAFVANTGAVASKSSGTTAATTVAAELLIAVVRRGAATTVESWSNSFTASFEDHSESIGTFVASSTGAKESTLSWTTSRVAGGMIATFYKATAGGFTNALGGPFEIPFGGSLT